MTLNLRILLWPLIVATLFNLTLAHSALIVNKKCGQNLCGRYEYCSNQDLTCRTCKEICDAESHNYDQLECEKDCSDFVHDVQIGYARKSDIQSLIDEVNKIYALLVVILILVAVLISVVGGVLIKRLFEYRKRITIRKLEQQKFQQKLSAVQYTISNNSSKRKDSVDGTMRQSMRVNMPSTMTLTTQTEESPPCTNKSTSTTKTLPLSIEEPCEDTIEDYQAYVNQALSHSPPHEIHLCPTKLDMS